MQGARWHVYLQVKLCDAGTKLFSRRGAKRKNDSTSSFQTLRTWRLCVHLFFAVWLSGVQSFSRRGIRQQPTPHSKLKTKSFSPLRPDTSSSLLSSEPNGAARLFGGGNIYFMPFTIHRNDHQSGVGRNGSQVIRIHHQFVFLAGGIVFYFKG